MGDDHGQVFKFSHGDGQTHEVRFRPGPVDPNASPTQVGDHLVHQVSTDPFHLTDYLPKPEEVTFGFVGRIAEWVQGPRPTETQAAQDRNRYEMLLSRVPGYSEFIAILNTDKRLGVYFTPEGIQKARVIAAQESRLAFAKIDQLLLAEVVAILKTTAKAECVPEDIRRARGPRAESKTEQIKQAYAKALLDLSVSGAPVPTEAELMKRFGCNRSTVNRAIKKYKELGRGVAEQCAHEDRDSLGFDEYATKKTVSRNTPKKSSR